MSNAATRVPRKRSTSRTVSRLCASLKWRSVARMMPRLDAAGRARPRHRVVDDRDDLLAAEAAPGMEQRRKAYLGVDHAVAGELRKEIVHDEAQRLLALHQRDVMRRRAQVFGQAPALGRRHEIAGKRLGRDVRGQAPHDLVAQAAVEVQVELDFGEGAQVQYSRPTALRAATKFLLYCPKCVLNFALSEFGIYILDVLDCIKIVPTFSVLWRFQCLNEQCFER